MSNKKLNGFTLAEVLITLVVIGVVLSLTIPTAVSKYQEQQTIQSLKAAYEAFSQAIQLAESKYGPLVTWDISPGDREEGSLYLYEYISPGLSKVKDCKLVKDCFADNYTNLHGALVQFQPRTWSRYARGILNNGVSFRIWSNGSGCHSNAYGDICGSIGVDVNGQKKPNRYGYDFFTFYITKNGLQPSGVTNDKIKKLCNLTSTNTENGISCTAWVLYKNNFDYKTKEIEW